LWGPVAGILRWGVDCPCISARASGAGGCQSEGGRTAAATRHTDPSSGAGSALSRTGTRGLRRLGGWGELDQGATGPRCQGSRPDRALPQKSGRADQGQREQAGQKSHPLEGAKHPRAGLQRIVFLPCGPVLLFFSLVFGPSPRET
jgi:hypothetical protein